MSIPSDSILYSLGFLYVTIIIIVALWFLRLLFPRVKYTAVLGSVLRGTGKAIFYIILIPFLPFIFLGMLFLAYGKAGEIDGDRIRRGLPPKYGPPPPWK